MREQKRRLLTGIIVLVVLVSLNAAPGFAEDKKPAATASGQPGETEPGASNDLKKSLMDSAFVLETDQESASESLERISGKIDMGFSAPENSYRSEEHPGAGPFAKQKSEEAKQQNAAD